MNEQIVQLNQKNSFIEDYSAALINFLEQMPEPGMIKDACGRYVFMNGPCGKLLNVDPDSVKGKSDPNLFDADTAFILTLGDMDVLKSRRSIQQIQSVQLNGHVQHLKISKFPVKSAGGDSMVGCTMSDITETIQKKNENNELKHKLIQAQKMETIGMLANGIAHDFNNILTSVQGFADVIQRELPEDSRAYRLSGKVQQAVDLSQEMISQMFSFTRENDSDKRPVHLVEVVEEILDFIKSCAPSRILVNTLFSADMDTIMANGPQVQQILLNLFTNAIQAIGRERGEISISIVNHPPREGHNTVNISGSSPATHVKLIISDTGSGIPDKVKDQIFDPFFTTKDSKNGTGLGLYTVKGIVSDHQGSISVKSKPEKGTTFEIRFPLLVREMDQ